MKAMQLVSMMQERITELKTVAIEKYVLFSYPTIRLLASHIESIWVSPKPFPCDANRGTLPTSQDHGTSAELWVQSPTEDVSLVPAVPLCIRKIGLSAQQEQMWTLYELEPDTRYNVMLMFHMAGWLDANLLDITIDSLVAHHSVLQGTYGYHACETLAAHCLSAPRAWQVPHRQWQASRRSNSAEQCIQSERMSAIDLGSSGALSYITLNESTVGQVHWLLLKIHHIATDGMSFHPLLEHLSLVYNQLFRGEAPDIPELAVQYSDWAEWEQRRLASGGCDGCGHGSRMQDEISYWREVLRDGDLPILELSTGRLCSDVLTPTRHVPVALKSAAGIRMLAQRCNSTPMHAILALWAVLLCKHSGQNEVVVGFPHSNRAEARVLNLVGYFVNTVAVALTVQPNKAFHQVVSATSGAAVGALAHGSVPFLRIVHALGKLHRQVGHTPVYQTMLLWQEGSRWSSPEDMKLLGLTVLSISAVQAAATEIELEIADGGPDSTMQGNLKYDADLYDSTTIMRMAHRLVTLAESAVSKPDQTVVKLGLMGAHEKAVVQDQWNTNAAPLPTAASAPALFETIAASAVQHLALAFEGEFVSYGELEWQSTCLALELCKHATSVDYLAGLCVHKSVEEVIGIVGIMRAGRSYVPLDPALPEARLQFLVNECACFAVVVLSLCMDALACVSTSCPLVVIARELQCGRTQFCDMQSVACANLLAYVLFTSGSTGRPKGVMVPHLSLSAYLAHTNEALSLCQHDGVLYSSAFTFDASVQLLWCPLTSRAYVAVAKRNAMTDPEYIQEILHTMSISFIDLVPSVLTLHLDINGDRFPCHLREMFVLGETCKVSLSQRVCSMNRHIRFTNRYGPAEATIATHGFLCSRDIRCHVPIGKPLHNVCSFVLDSIQQPVPVLTTGEIVLGGAQLARGYINRADLTMKAFYHARDHNNRVYCTGDRGRLHADGNLQFLGRIDFQVKLNGQRLETGEIEAVIRQVEGVNDVSVVLNEVTHGANRLLAYVTPSLVREKLITTQCHRQLAPYMIPSAVVPLSQWPLNSAGKLDRKCLASIQPYLASSDLPSVSSSPKPAQIVQTLEVRIIEHIQASTGISTEPTQPLMQAGINSLTAVKLAYSLQVLLAPSSKLPRVLLFDYPTVAAIADFVSRDSPMPCAEQTRNEPVVPKYNDTAVVITGKECISPGDCTTASAMWNSLCAAKPTLSSFCKSEAHAFVRSSTAHIYTTHGHFLSHVQRFDHRRFQMAPAEVHATDPSQRLLLETVFCMCTKSGLTEHTLVDSNIGVYIGLGATGWTPDTIEINTYSAHGQHAAAACGRISYLLGLTGPCLSVDTACSSSLVALDAANMPARTGKTEGAIVAGVNLTVGQMGWIGMCALHALSPDGLCKTFDTRADGLGRGESCSALVLSNVARSKQTKLPLINGVAVNQDGRSASLMAPNGPSQQVVIQKAWLDSRCIAPDLIEAHGTGTSLGDPIEVGALCTSLSVLSHQLTVVGALKSSIGHTEYAAGTAGLTKILLCMLHRQTEANQQLEIINPYLDMENHPLCLSSQGCLSAPRSAGVSSFGYAGTNAHVSVWLRDTAAQSLVQRHRLLLQQIKFPWWSDLQTNLQDKQKPKEAHPHMLEPQEAEALLSNLRECSGEARAALQLLLSILVREQIGHMISLDAPLIQSGLTSVKTVRLINHLQQETNLSSRLEVFAVFNHPTVRQLADHVTIFADSTFLEHPILANFDQFEKTHAFSAATEALPSFVTILHQPQKSQDVTGAPLFLVAPPLGSSAAYYTLAGVIGGPRMIYGLDTDGFQHDIHQNAHACVESLLEIVPSGLVHVGGYSRAGYVAVLIANLLEERKRKVGDVFLLDSFDPSLMQLTDSPRQLVQDLFIGAVVPL